MAALWSSKSVFVLSSCILVNFSFSFFVCFEFMVNVVVKDIYDETVVSLNINWGWIHILSITRLLVQKLLVIQMNQILQFHSFFLHFPFFSLLESGGVKCISPKFYLYESEAGNVFSLPFFSRHYVSLLRKGGKKGRDLTNTTRITSIKKKKKHYVDYNFEFLWLLSLVSSRTKYVSFPQFQIEIFFRI